MTVGESLKKYKNIEADLLLSHVLKKTKEFLFMHPEKLLTKTQEKYFTKLAKERQKGLPIAYLLGYKYFYGLKFKVTRDTLIPRPETEWLVENALRVINAKLLKKKTRGFKVLDMATGSGCIGISIKKSSLNRRIKVTATDVSTKALTIAKANAKANKVRIKFIKSNLFKNIAGKFDLVIANLPYIPISDYKKLYGNLKYEPKLALTDGGDNFKLLNRFLKEAPAHLNERAVVLLEVDPKFFKQRNDTSWRIIKDIHGLNRFALMKNYKK